MSHLAASCQTPARPLPWGMETRKHVYLSDHRLTGGTTWAYTSLKRQQIICGQAETEAYIIDKPLTHKLSNTDTQNGLAMSAMWRRLILPQLLIQNWTSLQCYTTFISAPKLPSCNRPIPSSPENWQDSSSTHRAGRNTLPGNRHLQISWCLLQWGQPECPHSCLYQVSCPQSLGAENEILSCVQ